MTHSRNKLICSTILLLVLGPLSLLASERSSTIARIIKMRGEVELFTNRSKGVKGTPPPHILYNGHYYSLKRARIGQKVRPHEIIRTGKKSRVRLVFTNGDQYTLGPGTVYEGAPKSKHKRGGGSVVNLLYGKFRAVISKKGPRKELTIRTRNAALGVRGTDLFVSKRGLSGKTKLAVLRGRVEAQSITPPAELPSFKKKKLKAKGVEKLKKVTFPAKPAAKAVVVGSGFSAYVDSIPSKKSSVKSKGVGKEVIGKRITLFKTDKRELVKIQKASKIKVKKSDLKKLSPKVVKEIKKLEKRAVENTLEDIKESDPSLFEQIKKQKTKISLESLTTKVVHQNFKKAPEKVYKPTESDLDDERIDAYETYFEE
jgi:hypothetical protein